MESLPSQAKQVFQTEINKIKEELIATHKALGQEATGKWIKNLEAITEITESNLKGLFKGLDYTEQLTQGQAPGTWADRESIIEWIKAKPITPSDNISIESLAFLISRKIYNEGTDYYPDGTELIDSVITPERIKIIVEKVGLIFLSNFEIEINELLIR